MLSFLSNLDGSILLFIQQYMRIPVLTPIFKLITTMGNNGLIWLLIVLGLLLFKRTRMAGAVVLLTIAVCFIINNEILKNVIARPRPFQVLTQLQILIARPKDFSFPSGHTATAFAAAGAFYFYGNKKWGTIAFIFAGLIGFSRLYLGVHYPSDVLCGAIIGLLISFMMSKIVLYYQLKRREKTEVLLYQDVINRE